jgi:hypothetical protein
MSTKQQSSLMQMLSRDYPTPVTQPKKSRYSRDKSLLWFANQLEEGVYKTSNVNPHISSGIQTFHCSAIGNVCDRYLWLHWNRLLPEEDIDQVKQRIFDHGNYAEERYTKYFEHGIMYIEREVKATNEYPPISGRADFILTSAKAGVKRFIVELKTINSRGFDGLSAPKVDHEIQLQSYLNMLDYDFGIVLYENKDNQKIKMFQIDKDLVAWQAILDRVIRIMNTETMPTLKSVDGPDHPSWCNCRSVVDE